MSDAELPLAPQPAPPKRQLSGWRKVLYIISMTAFTLRLLLLALTCASRTHATPASSAAPADVALPATLPTWPLKPQDVLTLTPGDPIIAKWSEHPTLDGFVVQQLEADEKQVPDGSVCVLEPDYMADASQPGGTLTIISHQPTGDWLALWIGGDTLPDSLKTADFNANCAHSATLLFTTAQLHDFLNILSGLPTTEPPPHHPRHSKKPTP